MSRNPSEGDKRLESIIETAIDGIITIDTFGMIESVNSAGARLFGYQVDELIGQNVSLLMPAPHRQIHDKYINTYLETGQRKIIGIGREVEGLKKDGTLFPIRLAVSEVQLPDKKVFTGVIHDLTEMKLAQHEIRKLNQSLQLKVQERTEELQEVVNRLLEFSHRLQVEINEREKAERELLEREARLEQSLENEKELNELKSRFVAMASHEFRTPLSTIASSAALIGRYTEGDQQANRMKHINRIKSSVSNMTSILNDFLSLSKLEEGRVEVLDDRLEMNGFCTEITEEIEGLLKSGQRILSEKSEGPIYINSDKRIVKNIFYNILSNAIKYSPENSTIYCRMDMEDEFLKITVRDEGIGIPEVDQKHLFTRFFRAHNVMNVAGTGLGLNIVLGYLELLGGKIDFVSKFGQGTTFFIYLPAQRIEG